MTTNQGLKSVENSESENMIFKFLYYRLSKGANNFYFFKKCDEEYLKFNQILANLLKTSGSRRKLL